MRAHTSAKGKPFLSITLSQVDRRPLDRFVSAVGGTVYGPYDRKGGNNDRAKPCYAVNANSTKAWPILCALWPYMSEPKLEQAKRTIHTLYASRRG